ncbi:hypothetical protein [Allofournierella sp.]|uniref:hypothetical protein n=1 Tax=Allofournierella sp. TaxID=1940256 RepID=UPI003AEFCC43
MEQSFPALAFLKLIQWEQRLFRLIVQFARFKGGKGAFLHKKKNRLSKKQAICAAQAPQRHVDAMMKRQNSRALAEKRRGVKERRKHDATDKDQDMGVFGWVCSIDAAVYVFGPAYLEGAV